MRPPRRCTKRLSRRHPRPLFTCREVPLSEKAKQAQQTPNQSLTQPVITAARQPQENSIAKERLQQRSPAVDLSGRAARLEARARALAPQADAYLNLMDQVAGHNFTQVTEMANSEARQAADPDGLASPFLQHMPADWQKMSRDQRFRMMAVAQEATREMRQDLRQGRTSALVDSDDLAHETTPDGVRSVMRVNQALQDNDMTQNFWGHSPRSVEDVRGLEGLEDGQFPDVTTHPAAFEALLNAQRKDADPQASLERAFKTGKVPEGARGLDKPLPNAKMFQAQLRELARERAQLDELAGDTLVAVPTLDGILRRMQALDDRMGQYGQELYERLGGKATEYQMVLGTDGRARAAELPEAPFRRQSVVDLREAVRLPDGRDSGMVIGDTSSPLSWVTNPNPGTKAIEDGRGVPVAGASPQQMVDSLGYSSLGGLEEELTARESDELVRVKDALELMKGNTSELSIKDLPMSAGLRKKLRIPSSIRYAPQPPDLPGMEAFNPAAAVAPRTRIDRAALYPVESRGKYLQNLNSDAYSKSLGERSRTSLTAEFDNTFLNRAAELIDMPGWLFKGPDRNNWIGPRADRNLERSEHLGKKVDHLTKGASDSAIYGQYGSAMDDLREAVDLNDTHDNYNDRYEQQHRDTEMETGFVIAGLPLSAMGAVQSARGVGRSLMRGTSKAVNRGAGAARNATKATGQTAKRTATTGRAATATKAAKVAKTAKAARAARPTAQATKGAARAGGHVVDDIATLRHANQGKAARPGKVRVDKKGFVERPTPLEDAFVRKHRKRFPKSTDSDDVIRQKFRSGKRFNAGGELESLKGERAYLNRKKEVGQLRDSPMFDEDLKARGISSERIDMMDAKKCPLSFENPKGYQEFQDDLSKTLKKMGLDDSSVTLKGTSTTFYSENPSKPLGHHFDANPKEIADIDLGVSSQKLVDQMKGAGKVAHSKIPSIYKARDTAELFPELKAFSERWEKVLGRPVNFVGLTDSSKPVLDATDYLVTGALK